MKRILFVIPNLGGGGAEKVLVNLVNHLDRTKYKVEIKTIFKENINRKFLKDGIKLSTCFGRQFRGNRILFKLFTPRFLFKRLIREDYDIIVSYLEGPGERIVSGCTNPQTKLVNWIHVEQHTVAVASSSYRSLKEFRSSIEKFSYTAFVSETVKQDYLDIVGLKHNNGVVYNTIDVEDILEKSKEEITLQLPQGLNVFSVGRLTNAKGFDRLIKAHKRLLDEGINHNVIILGEGELRSDLQKLAIDLKVQDSVIFLGFHKNPYKYLSLADLFVCSSRREGFSTAVTEALILGKPVVSTLCSGAKELLGNNEYGIVCENSENGVYEGMKRVLSTPGLLAEYQKRAESRGNKFLTAETTKAVERIFDSL